MLEDNFPEIKIDVEVLKAEVRNTLRLTKNNNTREAYYHTYNSFIKYIEINEFHFQPEEIESYIKFLQEQKYSLNTRKTHLTALIKLFEHLKNIGIIKKNPVKRIKIKIENKKRIFTKFDETTIWEFINFIGKETKLNLRNKLYSSLIAFSGLNPYYILTLETNNFKISKNNLVLEVLLEDKKKRIILDEKICEIYQEFCLVHQKNNERKNKNREILGMEKLSSNDTIFSGLGKYSREINISKITANNNLRKHLSSFNRNLNKENNSDKKFNYQIKSLIDFGKTYNKNQNEKTT